MRTLSDLRFENDQLFGDVVAFHAEHETDVASVNRAFLGFSRIAAEARSYGADRLAQQALRDQRFAGEVLAAFRRSARP
jgi:hypothetical protein